MILQLGSTIQSLPSPQSGPVRIVAGASTRVLSDLSMLKGFETAQEHEAQPQSGVMFKGVAAGYHVSRNRALAADGHGPGRYVDLEWLSALVKLGTQK
jgi:hypothetical protein